jgi:hypothetical protein
VRAISMDEVASSSTIPKTPSSARTCLRRRGAPRPPVQGRLGGLLAENLTKSPEALCAGDGVEAALSLGRAQRTIRDTEAHLVRDRGDPHPPHPASMLEHCSLGMDEASYPYLWGADVVASINTSKAITRFVSEARRKDGS